MAQKPKFPEPIPNPLNQTISDDEVTDPNIILPSPTPHAQRPAPIQAQAASRSETGPPLPTPEAVKIKIKMPELGPLDALMKDPTISEIMVNDLRNVMIEREGKLQFSGFTYQGIDELNRLVRNITDVTGRIVSPDNPYLDTMLPDGSRVNIVVPPLTIYGPCLTIRKFPAKRFTIHDLMAFEALDQRMAYFLNCCVLGRMNILLCGGTGSGKTTLLNVLSTFIPKGERLVTIEDTPELAISHFNSVRMQTKPQTPTSPAVTARDLVANALRMRPDRIIVGECRRSEAFDMLQAMNTGHEGSMTTLHANTPRDGLARLETLCMMANTDMPLTAVRKQISSAVDLIIQIRRFRNGKRRIVSITEVTGMEGETITLQDIFLFELDMNTLGQDENGRFKPTGFVPVLLDRLRENGVDLPGNYFA
jgi:pilus assembly protein CpaF